PRAKSAGLATSLVAAVTICLNCGANAASDLDRAYRTIAAKRVVDLTHSFGPNTPVWSGFGQARMTPAADPKTREPYTIAKDGFRTTFYEMVGQYGTHVDPRGPAVSFHRERRNHGPDPSKAHDPAARGSRRHASSRQGPEPCLLGRRSYGLGEGPRAGPQRRLRGTSHRHVQGLGRQSGALQTQRISSVVPASRQVPHREARRDGDRA